MNFATRLIIATGSALLCASGAIIANLPGDGSLNFEGQLEWPGPSDLASSYQPVASGNRFNFGQVEAVIRQDNRVAAHPGRIEFGSVQMKGATASVQVLFFTEHGIMTPYLYTLKPRKDSWKIESVQRLWFVPSSHLLRGLRV